MTARNSSGNIGTGGHAVEISYKIGTSVGTISSVTDNSDGTYTASFTGVSAGSAVTIVAMIDSKVITTSNPLLTVVPTTIAVRRARAL